MKKLTYTGLTYGLLEGNRALGVPATQVKPGLEFEATSEVHEKWLLDSGAFEVAGEAPADKFEGVVAQPFGTRASVPAVVPAVVPATDPNKEVK